jgi:hypothetical protein
MVLKSAKTPEGIAVARKKKESKNQRRGLPLKDEKS